MTFTEQPTERTWHVRLVWDEQHTNSPRMLLRPADAGEQQDWTEFNDQDAFLRHLWHLIDQRAGLR